MTMADKFDLCLKLANGIVKSYRDECPIGCDPQNTFAAVAIGVAGVAAAGASVYAANKQSKAADAQAKALGGNSGAGMLSDALDADPEDLYGTRFTPAEYESKVGTEDSYASDLFKGGLNIDSLSDLFELTKKINKRNLKGANELTGGQFGGVLRQGGKDIRQMLKGKVPKDVVDNINRLVAENLGGAVNPSSIAGGFNFSATAADTARRLGITSLDLTIKGLSFAPAWQQTVQQFLYRPDQAAKDFLFPQKSAEIAAESLQKGIDENQYYADNNILRAESSPDPQARGKLNDALTLIALQSGANSNAAAAQAGLINSYGALGSSVASLGKSVSGYGATQSTGAGIASGTPYQYPLGSPGPQVGTYYV